LTRSLSRSARLSRLTCAQGNFPAGSHPGSWCVTLVHLSPPLPSPEARISADNPYYKRVTVKSLLNDVLETEIRISLCLPLQRPARTDQRGKWPLKEAFQNQNLICLPHDGCPCKTSHFQLCIILVCQPRRICSLVVGGESCHRQERDTLMSVRANDPTARTWLRPGGERLPKFHTFSCA